MASPNSPLTPRDKLERNIEYLSLRCVRGRAAAQNMSVRLHFVLRILSIVLSFFGSAGVIADKISTKLTSETGGAFWGSVALLGFGILSQIASEFEIARRATASRSLAFKCEMYDTRMENMLLGADPTTDVANLLLEVNKVFESEEYNSVLPKLTASREQEATTRANLLIQRNQANWNLKVIKQRGVKSPKDQSGDR